MVFWQLLLLALSAAAPAFNGLCYVGYGSDFSTPGSDSSIGMIPASHANWVAVVFTWYQPTISDTTIAPISNSANSDDIKHAASTAHTNGLQVALKPHVDLSNDASHWRGDIGTGFTDSQWDSWFTSYESYMNYSADLAVATGAKLFIIGTELVTTETQESHWRRIISVVRSRLSSSIQVVYGCNWSPGPNNIKWWDALDLMGVDAYFPLLTSATPPPTADQITQAWISSGTFDMLANASKQWGKSLLFTECGYQSEQGCAVTPWAVSSGIWEPQCQESAYQAVFNVFYSQSWFQGVFWWAWGSNPEEGGKCDMGFSPHNKPAETVCQQNWPAPETTLWHPFTLREPEEMQRRLRQSLNLPTATPVKAYDCSTGSGWDNWSWSGTVDFKSTGLVAQGCSYSIHAQLTDWGCVSLHPAQNLNISGYTNVNITISVASTSISTIVLYLDDENGKELPTVPLDKYSDNCALPVNSFITVTVPLSDILFGVNVISRINFKNEQASNGEWWHGDIVFY